MNILTYIFRPSFSRLSLLGWLLVVVGLFLSVFIIGVPIFIAGWLILVYDMLRSWYRTLVPQKQREEIVQTLKKEYQPYRPALKSMKALVFEMLRVAGLVFVTGILIILLGFKFGWW